MIVSTIHSLRIFIEQKFFGSRIISWITGFILTTILFISALTGYILLWDQQSLIIANYGARLFNLIPIFHELPASTFSGQQSIDSSFFFINLFIHISLPVIICLIIWIHIYKISNPKLFINKFIILHLFITITLISTYWPITLNNQANLLETPKQIYLDWFYLFYVPLKNSHNFLLILIINIISSFLILLLPLYWKLIFKTTNEIANSINKFCNACNKCVISCPFDAIKMNTQNNKKYVQVNNTLCISCGICAAACPLIHMGPKSLKGINQLQNMKIFIKKHDNIQQSIILIYCHYIFFTAKQLTKLIHHYNNKNIILYKQHCFGALHIKTLEMLSQSCNQIFLLSCTKEACKNREGPHMLINTLTNKHKINLSKTYNNIVFTNTEKYQNIINKNNNIINYSSIIIKIKTIIIYFITSCFYLTIVLLTYKPYILNYDTPILRLYGRISAQKIKECKPINQIEFNKTPKHMQNPLGSCIYHTINYTLLLKINNHTIINKKYNHKGFKNDNTIFILTNIPIKKGKKHIYLQFTPNIQNNINNNAISTYNVEKFKIKTQYLFNNYKIKLIKINNNNK